MLELEKESRKALEEIIENNNCNIIDCAICPLFYFGGCDSFYNARIARELLEAIDSYNKKEGAKDGRG